MQVIQGKRMKPLALMIYGEKGLGKTNLPLEAPKPIYIGAEENDEIDAARLPRIEKWSELKEQLDWLLNKSKDGFKTLVIDGLDVLEPIAQEEILKTQNGKTMATAFGGYGKAFEKQTMMFQEIKDKYLSPLRDRKGMNIVILAHANKTKHEDPMTNTAYDTYSTALHKSIKPIFEDWVSAILFIQWELRRKSSDSTGKEYAVGDGSRIIYTEQRPSHVAKNRFNLPYEIDYEKEGTWATLMSHIKEYFGDAKVFKAEPKKEVVEPEPETEPETVEEGEKSNPEENKEMDQAKKAISEIFSKLPEDNKASIQLRIDRAENIQELRKIYKKITDIIKA